MSKVKYMPLGYRLLVEFLPVEEKTGIIIKAAQTVKSEQQAQMRAKILAIGPSAFSEYQADHTPKVGDTVLVAKYAGFKVPGEDNDLLHVYNDEDVAAVEVPA